MIATILRAHYSLEDLSLLPVAAQWASREAIVGSIAISVPGIKPLFSRSRWLASRNKTGDMVGSNNKNARTGTGAGGWSTPLNPSQNFEMSNGRSWDIKGNKHKGHRLSSSASQELIITKDANSSGDDGHAITITKETIVSHTH